MAIGNPINLTSNVEGKNISVIATAGQTQFTVTGGYRINQISVFRNGVRLVDGRDFTALDGSIVTLLSAATVADVIEFQVFDDFRVSDALNVNSGGTVNGNVTVTGILSTTNLSIGSSISLDATSGIVTAVQFIGQMTGTASTATEAEGLTGVPDITVNNIVAAAATFSGVVTYEDVTNIDSLGIVTARTGVDITANGLVVNAGVGTFAADVSIADKIVHTGDANTAIRFPSNDTFTVETSGVQRLEVNSTGNVGLVGIATATGLVVVAGSGVYAGHTGIITAVTFDGALSGAATQVTVADESSDTTCFPLFATAATGDLAPKSGTNLTFNSSSGALTATSFAGNLSGGTVAGSTGTFTGVVAIDSADGYALEVKNGSTQLIGLYKEDATGGYIYLRDASGTSNISLNGNDGSATFASDVNIADKIVHTGDTNTAIRFPAADTFTVETAGSERFRISSAGLVGIGTNIPENGLHVSDGSSFAAPQNTGAGRIMIEHATSSDLQFMTSNSGYSHIFFGDQDDANVGVINYVHNSGVNAMTFATNAAERLRITSAGDVHIGTTNAVVFGSRRALTVANGTTGAVLSLYNSTTATNNPRISSNPGGSEINDIGIHAASTNGTIQFYTSNDTERLRITSAGNVRVPDGGAFACGTDEDLTISHSGNDAVIENDVGHIYIRNNTNDEDIYLVTDDGSGGLANYVECDGSSGKVKLSYYGSKKLETTSDGIDVTGKCTCDTLRVDTTSDFAGNAEFTSGAGAITIAGNSDIRLSNGVWTGETSAKIQQHSNSLYLQYTSTFVVRNSSGDDRVVIDSSGNLTASGNVTAYSDINLKENIEVIPNALDKLSAIRGVTFDRTDCDVDRQSGVIAQEVEAVLPEVVTTNKEGIKSVAYGNLVGLLIESIKELKAEINDLKAQVEG